MTQSNEKNEIKITKKKTIDKIFNPQLNNNHIMNVLDVMMVSWLDGMTWLVMLLDCDCLVSRLNYDVGKPHNLDPLLL